MGRLKLEQVGEATVVRITVNRLLDGPLVEAVGRELQRLAGDPGRALMLLDFRAVESLSGAVLGVLLSLRRHLLAQGGRLAICGLRPEVREVFAIAALERVLNVHAAEQEALVSFLG
jgi:anti-anti-sigma factor